MRESHHLTAGTEFTVVFIDNEIRLKPLPLFTATRVEKGRGILARKGRKRLGSKTTDLAIGDMLKEADKASKE